MLLQAFSILYLSVCFWYWIMKCLKSKYLRHKTSYDFTEIKFWQKNAQILESDFGKSQNWKISVTLGTWNFQKLLYLWWNSIPSRIDSKSKIFL